MRGNLKVELKKLNSANQSLSLTRFVRETKSMDRRVRETLRSTMLKTQDWWSTRGWNRGDKWRYSNPPGN